MWARLCRNGSRRRAAAAAGRQARGPRPVCVGFRRPGILRRAAALRPVAPAIAFPVCVPRRCAAGAVREQVDSEPLCAAGVVGQGTAIRHRLRPRPAAVPARLRSLRTTEGRRPAALLASTCARIRLMSDISLHDRQRELWASLRAARQRCQRCAGEAGCQPESCCVICLAAAAASAPTLRCMSAESAPPLPFNAHHHTQHYL